MNSLLALLPLLFLSGATFGKTFECGEAVASAFGELTGEKAPVLVIATVNPDGKTGTIKVADQEFQANYQVEGLSLIHISEPTRQYCQSRMPSSA